MSNSLDIDDLENYPSCDSCGAEFTVQEDIDVLIYSRTTASCDMYYCSECEKESVFISSDSE